MSILERLPKTQELKKLIMHTSAIVWKYEITDKEIEKWLSNFKGEVLTEEEEKVLALWLLTNFVYYNEDEVKHLCRILLRDFIHKMLIDEKIPQADIDNSVTEIISKTRFSLLGKPGESGGFILYYFRQANDLPLSLFLLPTLNDSSSINNLVFIDDVTLTEGPDGQAFKQLKEAVECYKDKRIFFLTFIASEEAIKEFEKIGVQVITTITLDERNKCFGKNSSMFHSYPEYIEVCKKFAHHYGNKINSEKALGFKGGEYAFGFFYNTPDNTLPIFWGLNNWHPIFKRYDKKYKGNVVLDERFL